MFYQSMNFTKFGRGSLHTSTLKRLGVVRQSTNIVSGVKNACSLTFVHPSQCMYTTQQVHISTKLDKIFVVSIKHLVGIFITSEAIIIQSGQDGETSGEKEGKIFSEPNNQRDSGIDICFCLLLGNDNEMLSCD